MSRSESLSDKTRYRILRQVSHEIRDTLDVDETLEQLLDILKGIVDYDAAGIFVLNHGEVYPRRGHPGSAIAGVVMRGFDPLPIEEDAMLMEGKGVIGQVIRSGRHLLLPDVSADEHYVAGRSRTRSELAVPIKRGGRTVGALNLESDSLDAFRQPDLDVLEFFAEAASLSISKAMLHQQLMDKERMEEQLRIAKMVQEGLLPRESPSIDGYELAGFCETAQQIGGDYYDWFPLPDGRMALAVADVSGKGVPAALIMSAFRALLRVHLREGAELGAMAARLNRDLGESTGEGGFVTAVFGVFDPETGRFDYVNCGHVPPLLLRADDSAVRLEAGGFFLGIFEETQHEVGGVMLEPGDRLLLYTDGAAEIENREGVVFGVEGIETVLRGCGSRHPEDCLAMIAEGARAFRGEADLADDFTLLMLRRRA